MVKFTFRTPSASGPPGVFGRIFASLFFLGFFAMGCVFTYLVARGVAGMARTYAWEQVSCRIESQVARKNDDKPHVFAVRYRYEVGGRTHEGSTYKPTYSGSSQIGDAQRLVDRYPAESEALCWVDPKDPRRSRAIPLGGSATLDWKWSGAASRITRVEIVVEGREEASYRSGDSTHTDRSIFAKIPVFDASGSAGLAAGSATVSIPADTIHSFKAPNNKIVWTLKVRGEIPNWPDVSQDYELDVGPAHPGVRA